MTITITIIMSIITNIITNPRVSILKGFTLKKIIWGLVGSGRGVSITEAFAGFGTSKKRSHLKKSFRIA